MNARMIGVNPFLPLEAFAKQIATPLLKSEDRAMKYEKVVDIEGLAAEVFDQRQLVLVMRMQGVSPDLDKQREEFIKLKLAEAKLFELEQKLSAANHS